VFLLNRGEKFDAQPGGRGKGGESLNNNRGVRPFLPLKGWGGCIFIEEARVRKGNWEEGKGQTTLASEPRKKRGWGIEKERVACPEL